MSSEDYARPIELTEPSASSPAGTEVADDVVAPAAPVAQTAFSSRKNLLRRLADVVCLPESRINTFERAVTADLLVELLKEAAVEERIKVSRRLSMLNDIPNSLVRLLIVDEPQVSEPLIADGDALSDSDLNYCARHGTQAQRKLLAARKHLPVFMGEVLMEFAEYPVIETLLKNNKAVLSQTAIETAVALSQDHPQLISLLIKRAELRPSSAYILFWWAGHEVRNLILSRFAVNRDIMQDMAGDVFAMAAAENWQDPLSRKALQFIERRQRNREAIKKSPYGSLEAAIADAAQKGMSRQMAEEIAYMSGLKPSTGAKIMRDAGGEGLAVLCKATGLSKKALRGLWRALRRPLLQADGTTHPDLEKVLVTYDLLANDRAQTVLRYWNWSLSSALTPVLLRTISSGEDVDHSGLSIPERAAMLAFAQDLKR